MMNIINEILQFWFGELQPDLPAESKLSKRWWKKDPLFDQEIETILSDLITANLNDLKNAYDEANNIEFKETLEAIYNDQESIFK